MADDTVFTELDYEYPQLSQWFREMAYLNRGLTLYFRDERSYWTRKNLSEE